ncbi:MAG: hypothetical protein IKB71_07960 [Lentisphaeria bacterium]|nr:hypothetical protein [Lentisphaeria bacterium]
MKVTNIVLSIIILLLAIALAVSSFFLYEKREIMLNGWEKLTTTINETATELDKKSGTKLAEELTQNELHHTNYANLDDKLKKLNEGAANLVKQRDALANTIIEIARTVEANNVPMEEALTKLESSSASAEDVQKQVRIFRQRRDAVIDSIVASCRKIGVSVSKNDLKNGNSGKVFTQINKRLDAINTQIRTYENEARNIGRIKGVNSSFNAGDYRSSLLKLKNSVQSLSNKLYSTEGKLRSAENRVRQLNNTVKQRDQRISNLNSTINKKNTEVKQLKRALGLEPSAVVQPWSDGCKESRLAVKGKIIEINDKFGFYVVDIGKNTLVDQKIGNRINKINPKLVNNMQLTVARNMNTPEVKFVAKGKLTNVEDDCSIVEISDSTNKVLIGDDVFFAKDDLK